MEDNLVTHLTQQANMYIEQNPNSKTTCVMQVLEVKNINAKGVVKQGIILSDGYFYEEYFIIPSLSENIKKLKQNQIIKARLLYYESRDVKVLFDFDVVYQNVNNKIGLPIKFQKDVNQNPQGSNIIPQEIVFGDMVNDKNRRSKQKMQVEITGENGQRQIVEAQPIKMAPNNVTDSKFFTEIANLNIYDRSFRIRGRVSKKSNLRLFKKNTGKVFSCVIDDGTRAIQGTFFNDEAERYYEQIQNGKIYSFTDGTLRNSSQYNQTNNKIEIIFNARTLIEQLPETNEIKKNFFNLVLLEDLKNYEQNKSIDILVIVEDPGMVNQITLRNGDQKDIRNVTLSDKTCKINLSIWGDKAHEFDFPQGSIILIENVLVKDYNGKSLSNIQSTKYTSQIPELPQYKDLLLYKNSNGINQTKESLTQTTNAAQMQLKLFCVKRMNEESQILISEADQDTKYYFSCFVFLVKIPTRLFYLACRSEGCKKKVIQNSFGTYDCERCNKTYEVPKPRYIANLKFADSSGSFMGLTASEDQCKLIFDKSEEELYELQLNDELAFSDYCQQKLFQEYKVKISSKVEYYNNEAKIKFVIRDVKPILNNFAFYAQSLYNLLCEDDENEEVKKD